MGYARLLAVNRKPYATQDGHICALMYNDAHWQAFLKLVGQSDLFQIDARFATHPDRLKNIDALYGVVGQHMRTRTSAEWMKDFTAHDIPVMPMMKLDDLLTDPHLTATQGWLDVPHPFEGMLRQLRPPVRMSGTPTGVWRPAPRLGEHTEEVLSSLR
jgi:crotonobetainyl-CoA:carnitine CoA-transferase CaiB-like acyl-CoA transferase